LSKYIQVKKQKGNKMAAQYANSANQIAALKELYTDDI